MNFGVTGDAAPNAALSKMARYSLRGANRGSLDLLRLPLAAWNRSLLVGVGSDKLASTANPSAPTNPSARQRCTTLSNS